ncbi:hypothetical protein [Mucilaginibacter sp. L3T2-6]|uniref:hypothetical protein n=1 Tax=Mucilaginibacter sp. L3T2-6 TaxID=3062491 RepID=UPI002677327E|nr:hypothetical protein [Mucilaginibacter sp. L3T2-6]MDO3640929.1 hypothetical protein [Mucilaginibacter sp. L3T2-6]MDV6213595.1 hypothetical protein [Mucilaginibacter sp. L3T2-6]
MVKDIIFFSPLYRLRKRGQDKRSNVRVSPAHAGECHARLIVHNRRLSSAWTHPAIASPGDPLFAARKEGKLQFFNTMIFRLPYFGR